MKRRANMYKSCNTKQGDVRRASINLLGWGFEFAHSTMNMFIW